MRSNMSLAFKDWILDQQQKMLNDPESIADDDYNEDTIDNELEAEMMPHRAIHEAFKSSRKGSLC